MAVVFASLFLPLILEAQRRGFSSGRAVGVRPSGSMRMIRGNFTTPRPLRTWRPRSAPYTYPLNVSLAGTPHSLIDFGQSACLLNPSFAGSYFCRRSYSGAPGWGIQPVVAPYWFPSTTDYETEPPPEPSAEQPDTSQLADQVGNLAVEVERMREDQAARDTAPPPIAPPAAQAEEPPVKTLLIYRDGHRSEVQNYAILGQSLWVFSNQGSHRVPLADLDLAATKQSNEERGVDFLPPDQH